MTLWYRIDQSIYTAFSVAKVLCTFAELPLEEKLEDGVGDLKLLASSMEQLVDEERQCLCVCKYNHHN